MKREKHKKPKFQNSILLFCYLTGVFDRWFHRNKGSVEESTFLAMRIAAFTDYIAVTMTRLEEKTAAVREEALSIISTLDSSMHIVGRSMGQKREKIILETKKADLIRLDGIIRAESVNAIEILLPYIDNLKAQSIAYSHGYKQPIPETKTSVLFNIENNTAYHAYQQINSVSDALIHKEAMSCVGAKEDV